MSLKDTLMTVLAVVLPPAAVYLRVGLRRQFWQNVVFTLLGYVPGMLHALILVASNPVGARAS